MKKIIISFVFATLLCLLFAFSVGAKDVYLEPIPDELKAGDSDTATHFVVFEEEKYFTVTGTRITALNTEAIEEDLALATDIDASLIGSTYLTRFNFPATIGEGESMVAITEVYFETVKNSTTYFSNKVGYVQLEPSVVPTGNMNGSTSQLRCFDFGENSITTSIPGHLCNGATKMKLVKNFPQNVTTVGGYAFGSCKLAQFKNINLDNVTSFGQNAFIDCYFAFSQELYLNAKTIGGFAFSNALANVTKLILGPNVESIGEQSLCVRMVDLPSNAKAEDGLIQITTIEFQCDVSAVTFNSKAFYFDGTWARSPYEKLETIVLSHPNNEKLVVDGVSVLNNFTTSTVLFDATDGSAYYVTAIHNFVDGVMAYDSFLLEGEIVCTCTKCGATATKSAPAIFTCNGYSVPLDGELAITVCYQIDFAALNAYQTSTGNTIEHGLVVAVKSSLGENAPLDENGDISNDSVLKATLNSKYTFFKTKLTNISEKHKDTTIILCGYVVERNAQGDITKIVYLEEEQTTAETLSGVSYTSVSSKAS